MESPKRPSAEHLSLTSQFTVESFPGDRALWDQYKDDVMRIHAGLFPNHRDQAFLGRTSREIQKDFSNPQNTVFLLLDNKKKLAGFSSLRAAKGSSSSYLRAFFKSAKDKDIIPKADYPNTRSLKRATREVGWVEIQKESQHKGGWSLMMDRLDEHLLAQGSRYFIRTVAAANQYSEKVRGRYGEKIVYENELYDGSYLGYQKVFVVDMHKT